MKTYPVLVFLLISLFAEAQMVTVAEKPSFYLGMRSNITLSLAVQPVHSPTKPNNRNPDERSPLAYPYARPELTYTIALRNKVSFYVRGVLNKSSRVSKNLGIYDTLNDLNIPLKEVGMPSMKGNAIGAGFSFYRRKKAAIAPMGSHFSIGLSRHKYDVRYTGMYLKETRYDRQDKEPIDISNLSNTFRYLTLDIAFTNNQPITKKLYYHYGFSSSLNSRFVTIAIGNNNPQNTIPYELLENDLNSFLLRDIAMLKLGLGYMLF